METNARVNKHPADQATRGLNRSWLGPTSFPFIDLCNALAFSLRLSFLSVLLPGQFQLCPCFPTHLGEMKRTICLVWFAMEEGSMSGAFTTLPCLWLTAPHSSKCDVLISCDPGALLKNSGNPEVPCPGNSPSFATYGNRHGIYPATSTVGRARFSWVALI